MGSSIDTPYKPYLRGTENCEQSLDVTAAALTSCNQNQKWPSILEVTFRTPPFSKFRRFSTIGRLLMEFSSWYSQLWRRRGISRAICMGPSAHVQLEGGLFSRHLSNFPVVWSLWTCFLCVFFVGIRFIIVVSYSGLFVGYRVHMSGQVFPCFLNFL